MFPLQELKSATIAAAAVRQREHHPKPALTAAAAEQSEHSREHLSVYSSLRVPAAIAAVRVRL